MNSAETFDGAEEVRRAWMAGLAPDPSLTVSQWADRHRVLSSRAASEAGPYRTARTPYMKAVMDALPPRHPAQRVVFMKAAQVGATEACNNWIGFCMRRALGPFLAAQPTVDLAKRLSQQRIDPLIEESPDLRALVVPSRSWDAGNTILGTFHHLSSPSSQCQNGRPDGPTIKAKSFADCIRSSGDTCISARGSGRKRRSIRCRKALRCGCW